MRGVATLDLITKRTVQLTLNSDSADDELLLQRITDAMRIDRDKDLDVSIVVSHGDSTFRWAKRGESDDLRS